ncbi:hypothetical protein BC833DRAFT_522343 [Globomyces pollinis-pini]|nr:hypothetical protein BC833DRAFT_522343 [Globomyces pollinis-pini]
MKDSQRTVQFNSTGNNYVSNYVSTTKYNIATFFPKFLGEFFSKYPNLFFLLIALLQQIPTISPTSRWGNTIPLSFILILSGGRELLEDSKRRMQDQQLNSSSIKVLNNHTFKPIAWRDLKVGDIVKIENNESIAADIVILSSSEPDAMCYIETANLDGETNLKIRQGLPETADILTPEAVSAISGHIVTELPNSSLYTFEANLTLNGKQIPLSPKQLLLRGAQLRNTRWVYGIVVFTGHETKLMKNSSTTPVKYTKVERMVNTQIIFLFFLLLAMSIVCTIGQYFAEVRKHHPTSFIFLVSLSDQSLTNFLTFICLYNSMIPISLVVTVELVRFALCMFINNDLDMYYDVSDTPAVARTSTLIEELGQVDFIFSDKTGTLTRNVMEFKIASIAGRMYSDLDESEAAKYFSENPDYLTYADMKKDKDAGMNSQHIDNFMSLLAVCHTVIPEHDEKDPTKIKYQASSPDEAAFVEGASLLGYKFHTRRPRSVTISVDGVDRDYDILCVNEFNSDRKRMSVIVRAPDGQVKLLIKGADSVMFPRINHGTEFIKKTEEQLESFAAIGLRTLVLAYRDIPEDEFRLWFRKFEDANAQINGRQDALDAAAELIENELVLVGATAIEDKLQEGVPDTIATLMKGGIKVWVLTGDRQETAINIGYSCKLINSDMAMMICNEETLEGTKAYLLKNLNQLKQELNIKPQNKFWKHFWAGIRKSDGKFDKDLALIIDGKTLTHALDPSINEIFLELALMCKAVVCCRVSPLQKALVVSLVKENVAGSITLAIGDGANDVSMIQAAHVGVGISGMEGLQAARSADFAIGQFRFLRKLLLVHGSWAYSRVSKVILMSFYKNIVMYFAQFSYTLTNNFSAQTLFEQWVGVSSYNIVWTFLQPVAVGLLDQFVPAQLLDKYPQMYKLGRKSQFYNHKVFLQWIFNSLLHSVFIFYLWVFTFSTGDILADGRVGDNWVFGIMNYSTIIVTVTIKMFLMVDTMSFLVGVALFGSVIFYAIGYPLYAYLVPLWFKASQELTNTNPVIFFSSTFWLSIVVFPVIVNIRDIVWKFYKRTYAPQPYHIAQESFKYNVPDYRPKSEWFQKTIQKVKSIQKNRRKHTGFAFSQSQGISESVLGYDSTLPKPIG